MTQTKLISTPTSNILVIGGIPDNVKGIHIRNSGLCCKYPQKPYYALLESLPRGNWTILGKLSEITEQQASITIQPTEDHESHITPLYLLLELLNSHDIHIENPYEHPIYLGTIGKADYDYLEQQYEQAQHFTNPLILTETNLKNTLVNL